MFNVFMAALWIRGLVIIIGEIKLFAYFILITVVLSIIITPLLEVFNVGRERILLGSAIYNSFRAASDNGYDYSNMRDIDAVLDEDVFKQTFAETFAVSYDMICSGTSGNTLVFTNSDKYEDFYVDMSFVTEDHMPDDYTTTNVTVTAKSQYRFKTAYMELISSTLSPFELSATRTFTIQVIN